MPSPIDKIVLTRKQDRRYKTTKEDCEEMRKLYKKGFTQKEIAKKFGVCQATVGYIVSEKVKATLHEYRQKNPPKRRTTEEAREYMRALREYKRKLSKEEKQKLEKSFSGFSVYQFKKHESKKEKRYSK
jgi:predicted transcriptional regulator